MIHPFVLLALLLTLLPAAQAADIGLMPVVLNLGAGHDRGTVHVHNRGKEAVTLQADAGRWTREAGADVDAPSADLIVNPPLFALAPGATQIVRVGLRGAAPAAEAAAYRLVLREVPTATDTTALISGSVRVLVSFRLPVYVAPTQVRRDERWQVQRDASGELAAEVVNAGNVHLRVGTLRLNDGGHLPLAEHAAGAVLFPGESRRFALREAARPATAAAQPMTLEVLTDRGLQRVAVAAATR